MKTELEFESYFNAQIKPSLDQLEQRRLEINNTYSFKYYRIGLLVMVFLMAGGIYLASHNEPPHLAFVVGVSMPALTGVFALFVPLFILIMREVKSKPLITEYKQILKKKIVTFLDEQLKYDPQSRLTQNDFNDSLFFRSSYYKFDVDDLISGTRGHSKISICNINAIANGKGSNSRSGIFLIADLYRKFNGFTMVQPDALGGVLDSLGRSSALSKINQFMSTLEGKVQSFNFGQQYMSDSQFEKEFNVSTSDQAEASSILTQEVQRKLTEINQRKLGYLYITFKDSKIYVGLYNGDPFTRASYTTFVGMETAKAYWNALLLVLNVIDVIRGSIPAGVPESPGIGNPSVENPVPRKRTFIPVEEIIYSRTILPFVLRWLAAFLKPTILLGILFMAVGWFFRPYAEPDSAIMFTVIFWVGIGTIFLTLLEGFFSARKKLTHIEWDGQNLKIRTNIFDREDEDLLQPEKVIMFILIGRRHSVLDLYVPGDQEKWYKIRSKDDFQLIKIGSNLARPELGLQVRPQTQLLLKQYEGRTPVHPVIRFALRNSYALIVLAVITYYVFSNWSTLYDYYNKLQPAIKQEIALIKESKPGHNALQSGEPGSVTDPAFSEFLKIFGNNPAPMDAKKEQLIKKVIPDWDPFYIPGKILIEDNNLVVLGFQGNQFVYVAIAVMNKKTGTLISYSKIIEREQDCGARINGLVRKNEKLIQVNTFCQEDGKTVTTKEMFTISENGEVARINN